MLLLQLLSLLLPLHSCKLASVYGFLVVQRNVNKIIIICSLLVLLVNFDWPCAIEEIVCLLALQKQSIKVLMLFNKFLLGTSCLELVGTDLQRHLLAVLLRRIVRDFILLLLRVADAIVHHIVYKALDSSSRSYYIRK